MACGSCRGYVGPRRAQQVARVLARALPCAGRGAVVLRFLEWRSFDHRWRAARIYHSVGLAR